MSEDKKYYQVEVQLDENSTGYRARIAELEKWCLNSLTENETCIIFTTFNDKNPLLTFNRRHYFLFESGEKAFWFRMIT